MIRLKRITRGGRFQINYQMSDSTGSSFRVAEDMANFIDLTLGNIYFSENIHPGMIATEKYLSKVYHQHGLLALQMIVQDIAKEVDSLPRDAWCPKCGFQATKKLINEEWGYTCCGGDWCK